MKSFKAFYTNIGTPSLLTNMLNLNEISTTSFEITNEDDVCLCTIKHMYQETVRVEINSNSIKEEELDDIFDAIKIAIYENLD
jgi:hypothetical protein